MMTWEVVFGEWCNRMISNNVAGQVQSTNGGGRSRMGTDEYEG